jgi:hypothetical protein
VVISLSSRKSRFEISLALESLVLLPPVLCVRGGLRFVETKTEERILVAVIYDPIPID